MNIETKLNEYRPLPGFVCPAEFWPALGYEGTARYVAIYWEQCGDEAAWSDGRSSFVGANWPAYLALLDHNIPLGHAARWLLGSSEGAATMWLIIDRLTEWAWLVPVEEAWEVLLMQYPAEEWQGDAVSVDDLLAALDAAVGHLRPSLYDGPTIDLVEVIAQQYENDAAFEEALRGRMTTE